MSVVRFKASLGEQKAIMTLVLVGKVVYFTVTGEWRKIDGRSEERKQQEERERIN